MLLGVERRRVKLPERGVEIALLDWGGDGPLAFLHHANGFCAAVWGCVAERLRHRYRVVAMDARGHGDSTRPPNPSDYVWEHFANDLVAVVERLVGELGRERVALAAGHSFGGTSTAVAAAKRPDLFERIALVDPVMPPPPELLAEFANHARRPLAELARSRRAVWPSREAVRESWSRDSHAFHGWDRRALELYIQEGFHDRDDGQVELKCAPEVEASVFDRNASMDPFQYAPAIEASTLILWAARESFPRGLYERLAATVAGARIEDLDAGHLLPMEVPDLVAEHLLRFGAA